jgi:hypothetical protein
MAQEEGASCGRLTPNGIFLRFLLARCLPPPLAVRRVPLRRRPRAGSGAGPGLWITGRPACLLRAPSSGGPP